jgi:hypothetical protein
MWPQVLWPLSLEKPIGADIAECTSLAAAATTKKPTAKGKTSCNTIYPSKDIHLIDIIQTFKSIIWINYQIKSSTRKPIVLRHRVSIA